MKMTKAFELDRQFSWHPFTQMSEWCGDGEEVLILARGQGAWLEDEQGQRYLDGNSSIWTNLHGHGHPRLREALLTQFDQVEHVSYLGTGNVPASFLAKELIDLWEPGAFGRIFFSDNGTTAIEVALKMVIQYWQLVGQPERTQILAFENAYHGDTMGAASLGGVSLFQGRFDHYRFPVRHLSGLEELATVQDPHQVAAVFIEPGVQGVNEMRLWSEGMLAALRAWCDQYGVKLIADEVMTGFGRSGHMFASQKEGVIPDFVAVAKGLTGGVMPLAATFIREEIFNAFLGTFEEQKTFYYGHSYTANPLGCAVARANLRIFQEENVLERLQGHIQCLQGALQQLQENSPWVYQVRQYGFIAGIEIRDTNGKRFPVEKRVARKVCLAARRHQLLTRPVAGDVIILMLPYCVTPDEIQLAANAINQAAQDILE